MKFLFLLLLPALGFGISALQTKDKMAEELTRQIRLEMPHATRISVEKIFVNQPVPEYAKIEELKPHPAVGSINFAFTWEDEQGKKQAYGNAMSRVFLKVAISKAPIRHGESFSDENIKFEERELTPYSHTGYFTEAEGELFTLNAQGHIPPDHVISSSQTVAPQLIKAGQLVDLVYESPRLRISVRSKALQGGRAGDKIRVENTTSRKVVQGKVISNNEVRFQ